MPAYALIHSRRWGRAWRALLVGLMLLLPLTQLGAALHALCHHVPAGFEEMADRHGPLEPGLDHCDTCLAFAHLGAVDAPTVFVPPLLTGLVFAHGTTSFVLALPAELQALRNRGPPAAL